MSAENALSRIRPSLLQNVGYLSIYTFAFFFYGPLASAALVPFGLPQKHPAYFVAYGIGVLISLPLLHRAVSDLRNRASFAIAPDALFLGWKENTKIPIAEMKDVIPIELRPRLFGASFRAQTATLSRFNALLFRLVDGRRFAFALNVEAKNASHFVEVLMRKLAPLVREGVALSDEDRAVLTPRYINTLRTAKSSA